jgi:hypothetical protein
MGTITSGVTPLRQRMLEDMRMRKLERRTQDAYIRAVHVQAKLLKPAEIEVSESRLPAVNGHWIFAPESSYLA